MRHNVSPHHTVLGTLDVQIELVVENMVVHGPRQVIVDVEAIRATRCARPERTLDITRSTHGYGNRTIVEKVVLEQIIVVAYGGDAADNEDDVLRGTDVCSCEMALEGVALIVFEQTQTVGVNVCIIVDEERSVQVRGMRRTVEAIDKVPGAGTNTVRCIQVSRRGMERVLGGVMRHGLLETDLVHETLALELDVMELHANIFVSRDEEAEVHWVAWLANVFCHGGGYHLLHSTYFCCASTPNRGPSGCTLTGGYRSSRASLAPAWSVPAQGPSTFGPGPLMDFAAAMNSFVVFQ